MSMMTTMKKINRESKLQSFPNHHQKIQNSSPSLVHRNESSLSAWHSECWILSWCRVTSTPMNTGRVPRSRIASPSGTFPLLPFPFIQLNLIKLFSLSPSIPRKRWSGRYGHLTWEWKQGIRSYLHPMLFVPLYRLLALLRLDIPWLMVNMF